jgi:hypothetical protein
MLETAAASMERQPATLEGGWRVLQIVLDDLRTETLRTRRWPPSLRACGTPLPLRIRGAHGRTNIDFESSLFGVYITADPGPARYAVYDAIGFGLPGLLHLQPSSPRRRPHTRRTS